MKIILFDGVCNLCNVTINFIIKKDENNEFKFSSLQSSFSRKYLEANNVNSESFSTIMLIENDQVYTKSTAILMIFKFLRGYHWMKYLLHIPKFIRDAIYMVVSRNRYFLFGKNNTCMIPTKELKAKFLD
ncbi:thiol-disulfide oxidoreductase DCC family protein [Tenacibaculum xiamenense]|uniref:thiol-disulfide oxidoreductase DCC family protein n=1 Tax=Tenacibaculum xiamenense TaxID=1261553 RepID=UPI0038966111